MLKRYKAIFFDVGGTLLTAHPSVGAVYAEHARPFGYAGSVDKIDRQFSIEWKKSGGLEALGNRSGEMVERSFWYDLVFNVFEPFGGLYDFNVYFEKIYDAFKSRENWRVYEDVAQSGLLENLKSRGTILGVVSNWDSRLPAILENVGLAHYFDFILASTVVGSAKPDAKIFREALRKSGVAAGEACHIGDNLQSDFLGAQNLGMDAILVDRRGNYGGDVSPKVRSFLELV